MAVKGKGKQIAGKSPASTASPSAKRKDSCSRGEGSGARPNKRRSGVSQFVDDTAMDADFIADEEEEEEELDWEIDEDFDFELPDIDIKEVKNATKGSVNSSSLPFFIKEEEMDDDELEEAIKERYRGSEFVSFDEDIKECVNPELVAYTTKDLFIWRVKCMMGRERQAAFCLMQKFVDLLKIGKTLQIFSVFALDHVKGFVYVEADKASNVFEACHGLCILYPSRIDLVPRNEIPNLLSIQKKTCGISKGMWVRMKSGKYKGDLAEVVFVNDTKKRVTIKLVPRVDLQAIAKKFGGGTSLKAAAIPAPRLISCHELEDFRPHIEVRRDRETGEIFEVLDGLMLKDGYLYKKVSVASLIHWGVQPSSDELTKFEDLGKNDVKDVSWLSSIYKARTKKKLPETSHQTDNEKSNQKGGDKSNQKTGGKLNHKDGDKQRNGFDIDDLVLFGKKDCGIIVDMENDTFKVLKGDLNGPEVVTVNMRSIKKNCIDKVFTATDRCRKTISIDDVVKVIEGTYEGREGIVRHMYKGILFIYDECQTENNGFFCAKSDICDLLKKARDFGGGKMGSKAGPSSAQSPIISFEQDVKQEDTSQCFSKNRYSNSRGTFSVGQMLRIRQGPLKGYLCRVIRMHRADITVKLDSLGKLLTVDEKLLSLPNSKRDDASAMQCDMFGSQDEQSTGRGIGMDSFELNAGMSSFGRDSWNAASIPSSFPKENENKDEADPWGSKLPSWGADQEQGAGNGWGKAPNANEAHSSWNKVENSEKSADAEAWNNTSSKEDMPNSGWKNDNSVLKTDQAWSTKGANDGWNSAVDAAAEGEDGLIKAAAKPLTINSTETGGWGKNKHPISDAAGSWDTKDAATDWNKDASGNGKADSFGRQSGNWASFKSGGSENQDAWDINGKDTSETGGWKKTVDENLASGLAVSAVDDGNQSNSWGTAMGLPTSSDWGNSKAVTADTDIWVASATKLATPSVQNEGQANSWDKVSTLSSSSGWQNSKPVDATSNENWKKDGFSSEGDGWNKVKSSDRDESSGWNKVGNGEGRKDAFVDSWTKPKGSDGQGFGQESQREWKAGKDSNFGKLKDSDWSQGLGWSQGNSHCENGKRWGDQHVNSWNQQRDSDGGRGFARGRGRARFGGRGGRNRNNFENPNNFDGFGNNASTNSWGKPESSEGQGFGQENESGWKTGNDGSKDGDGSNFGKSKDSSWSQGSGWSQGNSNNESYKNWGDRGNSWNQQRDSDGGRGFSRGRGRGRFGGREGRNDGGNFEKLNNSDGFGNDVSRDSWGKPKSSEGHGFGQENESGWKTGNDWSKDNNDSNFGKSKESDWGQGSGWSQGNSNNENGKNWGDQGNNSFNQQSYSDGGRGFGRGRGRGRFVGRGGRNDGSNFENSDGGWRSGRGGGRGWNGASSYNRDNSDTREFGQGRGRLQGQGHSEPSDWRNAQENSDDGKALSSWGAAGGSSWGKPMDEQGASAADGKVGWNTGNSFAGGSTSNWDSDSKAGQVSDCNKAATTGKQVDTWGKDSENLNWSAPKALDNKLSSWNQASNNVASVHSNTWEKNEIKSTNTTCWGSDSQDAGGSKNDSNAEKALGWTKGSGTGKEVDTCGKDTKNGNWNAPKTSDNKLSSWNQTGEKNEIKGTDMPNSSEVTLADWAHNSAESKGAANDHKSFNVKSNNDWSQTSTALNKENEAGSSEGSWAGKPAKQPSSENENNWDKCSKGWGDNNFTSWDSSHTPSQQGNWGAAAKDSFGSQSSDNKWSNQSGGSQGNSSGWGCGSDSGRGRGSDSGRGWGRGRDGSFSGRGRGRGRNFGGVQNSSGWNSNNGSFEGKKGGWISSGGNEEKGSWGAGSAGQSDTNEGSKSSWTSVANSSRKVASGWESGSLAKETAAVGFGDKTTTGWESASATEPVVEDKASDKQENDPWGKAGGSSMGDSGGSWGGTPAGW